MCARNEGQRFPISLIICPAEEDATGRQSVLLLSADDWSELERITLFFKIFKQI